MTCNAGRAVLELAARNGAGVDATSYSTAAVQTGQVMLGLGTTVILDEAPVASTREQHQLLAEVEASGERLIQVGDQAQSHAVGAGGLWLRLEQAGRVTHAHIEMTRSVRANGVADRRDQRLFRDGQHEQALRGYHARGHVAEQPQLGRIQHHPDRTGEVASRSVAT